MGSHPIYYNTYSITSYILNNMYINIDCISVLFDVLYTYCIYIFTPDVFTYTLIALITLIQKVSPHEKGATHVGHSLIAKIFYSFSIFSVISLSSAFSLKINSSFSISICIFFPFPLPILPSSIFCESLSSICVVIALLSGLAP